MRKRKRRPKLDFRNPHDDPDFAKRLAEGWKLLYNETEPERPLDLDSWGELLRKLDAMGL